MQNNDLIRRSDVLGNINKRRYYFDKAALDEAFKAVYKAPTVDAVHVVRCKDCVLWRPVGGNTGKCPFLIGEHQYTGDDHFCSCGERKEDEI